MTPRQPYEIPLFVIVMSCCIICLIYQLICCCGEPKRKSTKRTKSIQSPQKIISSTYSAYYIKPSAPPLHTIVS